MPDFLYFLVLLSMMVAVSLTYKPHLFYPGIKELNCTVLKVVVCNRTKYYLFDKRSIIELILHSTASGSIDVTVS